MNKAPKYEEIYFTVVSKIVRRIGIDPLSPLMSKINWVFLIRLTSTLKPKEAEELNDVIDNADLKDVASLLGFDLFRTGRVLNIVLGGHAIYFDSISEIDEFTKFLEDLQFSWSYRKRKPTKYRDVIRKNYDVEFEKLLNNKYEGGLYLSIEEYGKDSLAYGFRENLGRYKVQLNYARDVKKLRDYIVNNHFPNWEK